MNKIILVILLILSLIICSSCSISNNYPHIKIFNSIWMENNLKIPITDGFVLDEYHPYETTKNDVNDSLIVSIYFRKDENN